MSKPEQALTAAEKPAVSLASLVKSDEEAEASDAQQSQPIEVNDVEDIESSAEESEAQEEDVTDTDEAVLLIDQPKCLQCSHLVVFAEKSYKGCHFTQGNKNCPAQSVTIMVQVPPSRMKKIVRNFLTAEEESDTEKLGRLYAELSQKKEWLQRQVLAAIEATRNQASAK